MLRAPWEPEGGASPLGRGQHAPSDARGPGPGQVTLVLMKVARGPLPSSDDVLSVLLREGATIWPVVRST